MLDIYQMKNSPQRLRVWFPKESAWDKHQVPNESRGRLNIEKKIQ